MKPHKHFWIGILVFFITAGYTSVTLAENIFEKEVDKEKLALGLVRQIHEGDYNVVSAAELKQWTDEKKEILIVDTMPYTASYQKAHIPHARQFLFPIAEMESWDTSLTGGKTISNYQALLGKDKSRIIVFYCGFVKCTRSHNGAMWARKLGYRNVYRFPGGIYAWKGSGYPVQQGDEKQ